MAQTPLRILFVSGYLPPHAPIGAVRPGKLDEYWRNAGHDVRTIAIALPSSISAGDKASHPLVHYLPYEVPGRLITKLKSALKRPGSECGVQRSAAQPQVSPPSNTGSIARLGLVDLYRQAVLFPDRYRSWIRPATRLGLSWRGHWKPDFIYSSGPPHSGQVVAARLAAGFQVPWIAELRDLWIGDPYFDRHMLIKPFHDRFAQTTLSRASAFVVVTNEACERLERITEKPILLSYNGYDPKDFEGLENVEPIDRQRLTIVHAGTIYPGRRDPTPLFKAIAALGEKGKQVRCLFYSDTNGSVAALSRLTGIEECVEIREAVPRSQILRVERQADILLECRWIESAGDGVIPGKLFEYIGARRPILSLGSLTGEAAAIVRDNSLGLVSNDPDEIKAMLAECLDVKSRFGRLPDRILDADDRFRRETQFQKIDGLVQEILASAPDELKDAPQGRARSRV
jgi:hypothetical protein